MLLSKNLSPVTSDAIAIWQAAVDAVRADRVVEREVQIEGRMLSVQGRQWPLNPKGRLIIVGAGKATYGMAQGISQALRNLPSSIQTIGWINVPDGTVEGSLDHRIHACQARPLGANEPTPTVQWATQKMVELLASASQNDTVIGLFSGGGSALLCAPVEGVTLEDKLAVTRWMSRRGATIEQLNLVRSALSRVKRGGLARCGGAGQFITLLISDVLGDPLATIASGPTVVDSPIDPEQVLKILETFDPGRVHLPASIYHALARRSIDAAQPPKGARPDVAHCILANNATAVDAAGMEAVRRGYAYYMKSSPHSEGPAEALGRDLARQCMRLAEHPPIQCWITGGEPTVVLSEGGQHGKGGRNQHLVLAAFDEWVRQGVRPAQLAKMVILSGGTDGEDGPTDAAGAWLDATVFNVANEKGLDAGDYLRRCDSYNFFDQVSSLLKTGPTHTNVCDIRVAIFDSRNSP